MAIKPQLPLQQMLGRARATLGMSQREFGPALGSSHRTAQRWDAGRSVLSPTELRRLAELLAPIDPALAEEAAAHLGETLEDLGLVAPGPASLAVGPSLPAAPARPEDLADIVLCAAAEAADLSPRAMRMPLCVAFRRAHQLGLTLEQIERALAPPAPKKKR